MYSDMLNVEDAELVASDTASETFDNDWVRSTFSKISEQENTDDEEEEDGDKECVELSLEFGLSRLSSEMSLLADEIGVEFKGMGTTIEHRLRTNGHRNNEPSTNPFVNSWSLSCSTESRAKQLFGAH